MNNTLLPTTWSVPIRDSTGSRINCSAATSALVTRGPIRLADLYKVAAKHANVPVKK
jgi:hypothetical protein